MKYHLFVSYSHRDEAEVLKVVRDLKTQGLEVWIDREGDLLGKPLNEALETEMRDSLAVGVFIGPQQMGDYHRREVNAALGLSDQGVDVFPVFLPSAPPDLDVPAFLTNRGGVDLRNGYATEVERFARTLRKRWERLLPAPAAVAEAAAEAEAEPGEADEEEDEDEFELEAAVDEIVASFQDRPPTLYLGSRFPPAGSEDPPTACNVAHELLKELGMVKGKHDGLLPSLETAGRLYAAARSAQRLERRIRESHVATPRPPAIYHRLVRVLQRILADLQDRCQDPLLASDEVSLQLVVTTNTDLWLERSLVAARVPFTRVVMSRSGSQLQVNAVEAYIQEADTLVLVTGAARTPVHYEPGGTTLRRGELDRAIPRHGKRLYGRGAEPLDTLPAYLGSSERKTPLLLYKHHGSHDWLDSCAVSTDHYFELAGATAAVPATVTARISNTPALLLGYSQSCDP